MFAGKHRPDAADSLREAADAAFEAPLALITEGQAAGAVVAGDPERVATVAWAALQGLASMVNGGMLDDAGLDGLVATPSSGWSSGCGRGSRAQGSSTTRSPSGVRSSSVRPVPPKTTASRPGPSGGSGSAPREYQVLAPMWW